MTSQDCLGTCYEEPLGPVKLLGKKYSLSSKRVISSSYWKVPDRKANLTSVACHDSEPLVAVASASKDSNIFIYELSAPPSEEVSSPTSDSVPSSPEDMANKYSFIDFGDSPSDLWDPQQLPPSPGKKTHRKSYHDSFGSGNLTLGLSSNSSKESLDSHSKHCMHKRSVSETLSLPSHHINNNFRAPQNTGPASYKRPTNSNYTRPLNRTPVLTHHQTISLGGIHSLDWVPSKHKLSDFGNVLATGHSGLVHLVMLPDPYQNDGPAEILSRFNHTKHLSPDLITSTRIRTVNVASSKWTCSPESSILSLFSEHLYLWDPSRCDVPIIKQRNKKARSFHSSPLRNGIVTFATDRGISIMDIRYKNPPSLAPPNANDGMVSLVKWSPLDENRVASVHDQTIIKIWDIRGGSPLMTLDGHYDKINSIDWSLTNENELFSASSDGTVRLWDLEKCSNLDIANTGSSKPPNPPCNDKSGDWMPSKSWRLYRQRLARENSAPSYNYFLDNIQNADSPCTTIFSKKKEYLELATVQLPLSFTSNVSPNSKEYQISVPQMITIDNEGFFGLHSRIPTDTDTFEPLESEADQQPAAASASPQSLISLIKQTVSSESTSSSVVAAATAAAAAINKDRFELGHAKRNSLDSLASMTSKSINGDSDMSLDDSLSETSSSIGSGQASPTGNSSSPVNPPAQLYGSSLGPDQPSSGFTVPKPYFAQKHHKNSSFSSMSSVGSTGSAGSMGSIGTSGASPNFSYMTCDPKVKANRRHTVYLGEKASTFGCGFDSSLGTTSTNSATTGKPSHPQGYDSSIEPLKLSKPHPTANDLYKPFLNESSSSSMTSRSSRRSRSSTYGLQNDSFASKELPALPAQKVRFSFPAAGY